MYIDIIVMSREIENKQMIYVAKKLLRFSHMFQFANVEVFIGVGCRQTENVWQILRLYSIFREVVKSLDLR